jgi:hypothetical protein
VGCQEGSSRGDTILSGGKRCAKQKFELRRHCAKKDAQYTRGLYSKCIAQIARKSRAGIAQALRILWPDRPYGPCRPIAHLIAVDVTSLIAGAAVMDYAFDYAACLRRSAIMASAIL